MQTNKSDFLVVIKNKNKQRLLAAIILIIAFIGGIFINAFEWANFGFVPGSLGYFVISVILVGGLVISLLLDKLKAITIIFGALKVFDSVLYSQMFLSEVAKNKTHPIEMGFDIVFGIAALVIFLAFIFYLLENIFEFRWTKKAVKVSILLSSALMFVGAILCVILVSHFGRDWFEILMPFNIFILYIGFYFTACYID
ncbi:MAG: hypothetical protein MJ227_01230 [Bacilli bacterium]|nr:hypothetical protein [Bacilli bacterium]